MRRIVGLGVRGGSPALFPCTVKSRERERHVPFLHGVDLSTLYASPGQTTWRGGSLPNWDLENTVLSGRSRNKRKSLPVLMKSFRSHTCLRIEGQSFHDRDDSGLNL